MVRERPRRRSSELRQEVIDISVLGESEKRAFARLALNPDFKTFLRVLEDEKQDGIKTMLSTLCPPTLHQLQGSTRMLADITQAVMLAPQAVAAINRN